jgi:hypothetical protein
LSTLPTPVIGNLAGFAGFDLPIAIAENFDVAGGDRKTAGQEQFGRFGIVIRLAQHRHRCAEFR